MSDDTDVTETPARQTVLNFAITHLIRARSVQITERPDRDDDDKWARTASHYMVTLTRDLRGTGQDSPTMSVLWSQGSGIKGLPKVTSVLDSLASDAQGIDNARSFEEWASEYGYDTDSRKAETTYNACRDIAKRLRKFLGADLYTALLDCERE